MSGRSCSAGMPVRWETIWTRDGGILFHWEIAPWVTFSRDASLTGPPAILIALWVTGSRFMGFPINNSVSISIAVVFRQAILFVQIRDFGVST